MANPSRALSRKSSSSSATSAKKMFGDLPPNSNVTGMMFSAAYCMIRRPVVVSPVKAILAIRLLLASGLPASTPKPFTTLTTPGGSRSPIASISTMIPMGVCSAGFSTTQFPAARGRGELPHRHQQREVPGNDLPDHAQRLMEMIGDRVLVDLAQAALLRAQATREIAEVV